MICPNHSYRHDPEVMMEFSKQVGEDFNFVAAREVFDYQNGFNGWLLQKMGVYSVVRGAADRESFKMTRTILATGKKKLVLFPEGEISLQNETLLPLETGACQLSFWAQDELNKTDPGEPIYIVPIAMKYSYRTNITDQLEFIVTRIEKRLSIQTPVHTTLYARVRVAALKVLEALERQYGCKPGADATLDDRMTGVKEQSLRTIAEVLDIDLPPLKHSYLDWVRVLRNSMDDFIYSDTATMSGYERKIHEQRADQIRGYYRDVDRIVGFIAVYDGYLSPPATQERMANVIEMLEAEVFGERTIKGPRLVTLDVGTPINLATSYQAYKKNKKVVIEQITTDLSGQIRTMLDALEDKRQPVYIS